MKNHQRKSETKDIKTYIKPGETPGTTEESPSHNEVKILLAVVAGVLILLIGGSAFLNFQNSDDGRFEAMEEALLNNKSRMLRDYDPLLVNAVKIYDYEVTHQSRDYNHIAVQIAVPNLVDVYDYYFDQLIKQEVWLKEDPQSSLQDIYRQAVEQGELSIYPLEEELLLREEEERWEVRNPEVLELVLPHNPTEEIVKDFERVLAVMGEALDFSEHDGDPVLQEVMTALLEEDFFNGISFDWHRDPEGENYRITAIFNEIMKIQEVGSLDDFRHRREEIGDRESLVDIIIEELREKTQNERDLRVFEVRKVNQPRNNEWGFRLISRGGRSQYYQQLMENIETFPQIARMNFTHLENYYKSVHVTNEDPWPEALAAFNYNNDQVVARDTDGADRRKLILKDGDIWYRIYDPARGEVEGEILLREEIQKEEVMNDDFTSYVRNGIRRGEGYDLVFFGENGEYIYRVDWEPELTATRLTPDAGDFSQEEIFYLANRPYHMGERGVGKDREQKVIQLMDMEKEQVLIEKSYDQLSNHEIMLRSDYFVSEAHDMLIVYYLGPEGVVEEILPKSSLEIYRGTEAGLELDQGLTDAFREIGGIRSFTIMDKDRIFLANHQNEQWILDLEKNIIISIAPGPYEKQAAAEETAETAEEDESEEDPEEWNYYDFEDHHYRFTPLSENVFFAEHFIHSSSDKEVFRREIWTVEEEVTRKMIFQQEDEGYTMTYSGEDQVFVATKDNQELMILEADPGRLASLPGGNYQLTVEDLLDHEAFTLLDRYEDVNEELEPGQLMIFGQYYFFSPNHKFYSSYNNHLYNPFRYDRNTGNLFFIVRGGDPYMRVLHRESDHQPMLPLWDYQELKLDQNFTTLYYRDREGAKVYNLTAFLESIKILSAE